MTELERVRAMYEDCLEESGNQAGADCTEAEDALDDAMDKYISILQRNAWADGYLYAMKLMKEGKAL